MGFVIIPALIIGLILGLLELFFIHSDEAGMGWFIHGLHTIPVMMIFLFISMNLDFFFGLLHWQNNIWLTLGARIGLGLIALAKIQGAAAIVGRTGQRIIHTIIIVILIIAAPYIWEYLLAGLIGNHIPTISGGGK